MPYHFYAALIMSATVATMFDNNSNILNNRNHNNTTMETMVGRIVDGKISPQIWPFMAAIGYVDQRENRSWHYHHCGGVIWNEATVITAAHCTYCLHKRNQQNCARLRMLVNDPYGSHNGNLLATQMGIPTWRNMPSITSATDLTVLVGHPDIRLPADFDDRRYLYRIRRAIEHEQFDPETMTNDIAVLRVDREIRFETDRVECVCEPLPLSELRTSHCVEIGWGWTGPDQRSNSDQLRQVRMPIRDAAFCRRQSVGYPFYEQSMLCAGYDDRVAGSWYGDSGGPLMCPLKRDRDQFSIVGIISSGADYDDFGDEEEEEEEKNVEQNEMKKDNEKIGSYDANNSADSATQSVSSTTLTLIPTVAYHTRILHYLPWIAKYSGEMN